MKQLLIILVVLVIGGGAFGFYQGWFTAVTTTDTKGSEFTLKVDEDTLKKDKEAYQKKIEAQLKELDSQLEQLTSKAREATNDAKARLDKEVANLQEKQEAARKKLGEIKDATAEKWRETKARVDAALDDLKKGFESTMSHFK